MEFLDKQHESIQDPDQKHARIICPDVHIF